MPVLALGKQRLDPDTALAHGFVIWFSCMIGANLLNIFFIEVAFDDPPLVTGGALWLERTRVTGCSVPLVAFLLLGIGIGIQRQDSIVGADIHISLGIIAKLLFAIEGSALVTIW